jgi:hypothetical protein
MRTLLACSFRLVCLVCWLSLLAEAEPARVRYAMPRQALFCRTVHSYFSGVCSLEAYFLIQRLSLLS